MSKWYLQFFRRFVFASLMCACMAAWALPSPKDIEAAVDAGRLSQAESMLREVIQEKPQSAKAHFELGEVLAREGHYSQAVQALKEAQQLDPSLKFTNQPEHFNALLEKVTGLAASANVSVNAGAKAGVTTTNQSQTLAVPAQSGGIPLSYIWLGIALLVVVALVIRRRQAPATVVEVPVAARGFGGQFTPNVPAGYPPGYAPQAYPPGYAPTAGGSTMTGAVVGGLAGVAAGYALSRAMEGDHRGVESYPAAGNSGATAGGYVPIDNPAPPDFGSFDAGAGDGWDNSGNDVASGGDDSW